MISKIDERNSDIPSLSFDDAQRLINKAPAIPGTYRQIVGSDNLKDLVKLLTLGIVSEVDALLAANILTPAEATQYTHLIPEFSEVTARIDQITINIFNHIRPGLVRRFKNQLGRTAKTEEKLAYVLNALYMCCNLFTDTDRNWGLTLLGTMYNSLVAMIFQYLYANLPVATERESLLSYCDAVNEGYARRFQSSLPGVKILTEQIMYTETLAHPTYAKNLDTIMASANIDGAKKPTQQHFDLELDELRRLKEYRAIHPTQCHIGDATIVFFRDGLFSTDALYPGLCELQIILDPRISFSEPDVTISKDGRRNYLLLLTKGVFSVRLDLRGDIVFSCNSAVSLENLLGKERYFLLKYKVVSLVRKYLADKAEDIPDLFLRSVVVAQPVATRQEILDTIQSPANNNAIVDEAIVLDDPIEIRSDYEPDASDPIPPLVNDLDDQKPVSAATQSETTQSETNRKAISVHRSLKGELVYRALVRLLGKPRIHSSHYIFTGRNGKKFPISIHFGQDIRTATLATSLKKWEISPSEFLAAL